MQLSKILLPVDFSDRSAGAAHYAKALATRFGSELIVAHVFELREVIANVPEAGVPPHWYEDRRMETCQMLERFQADEFRDLKVRRMLLEGDVAQSIVDLAHTQKVDVIVMPTHGYGRFRRFILGSVTAKILHDADCPVLTGVHIDRTPSFEPIQFREILCALDFDEAGEHAARWAADFAQLAGARLTVVHALPNIPYTDTSLAEQGLPAMFQAVAREQADALNQKLGIKAEFELEPGPVHKVVHNAALARNADLVVVGRHIDSGLLGRLRGHAYAIVRESPCPVVSV